MAYPYDTTANENCVPSALPIPHLQPGDPLNPGKSLQGDMSVASGAYVIHPDGDVTTGYKEPRVVSGGSGIDGGSA